MGRKKKVAVEASSLPAEGVPAPPPASESQDAVARLAAEIRAAMERARARLPEGLRENAFIVEHALNKELDKVSFAAWRMQAFQEFFAMLNTGKSEAPHDPTEVA